ncbi:MAG TPA: fibronectin type III domain-containing protein, partial [Planctomycetota bacterium]|nr:fibronectin type III domain-containing protein [Planctomycetota bacterium]
DSEGNRIRELYPHQQSPFYGLAPGKYQVRFQKTYLSLVPVEVQAGKETEVKLAEALGKVRLVPMENEELSWLEFLDQGGKPVRELYPYQQSPFYGLAPGEYQVRFERQHLTAVHLTAAAGKEAAIDLKEALGRLEFELIGGARPGPFDLNDADLATRVASVEHADYPFFGVAPGRYLLRFRKRDLPEVKVTIAAGRRTRVIPGKTEAGPEDLKQGPGLPVQAKAGDTTTELSWSPPAGVEVVGYRVYRPGSDRPIHGARLLTAPRFLDIGLINGRSYAYIVRAVRPGGDEWRGYQPASAVPAEVGKGDGR